MAIRNPMDWMAIYHTATKNGGDDLKFAKFILADLTHYSGGGFADEDARSLANALFAYLRCNDAALPAGVDREAEYLRQRRDHPNE